MNPSACPARSCAARSPRARRRLPTLVGLLASLATTPLSAQSFLDWKGLQPGPHPVGFRAIAASDATRSYGTPTDYEGRPRAEFGNRPIQIGLWYPAAAATSTPPMTYGDYIALLSWELGAERTGAEDRRVADELYFEVAGATPTAAARAALAKLSSEKVWARRDAPPAVGRFPLLLYAPGQGYPVFDNSVMAELLASHGFVVLTSPSAGPDAREMPDSALGIDTQARDLEFLLGFAQTLPQVDPDRVGAMGFSLGGASAALFTLRNTRVKALVSLDGVLRDDRYLSLLAGIPQFKPERLRASLLWLACAPESSLPGFGEGSFPDQAKYADEVKAVLPGVVHHDLSSMSNLQHRYFTGEATRSEEEWTTAVAGYELTSRLVLAFLKSRLAGLGQPLDSQAANGVTLTLRSARKAPPTPADFRAAVERDGVAKAGELLKIVQRDAAEQLPAFEEPVVVLGYNAIVANQPAFAIELFTLAVATFPGSIDGSYGLAKAYVAAGSYERAEPHYRAARDKVVADPSLPAEQKRALLARLDKILDDVRAQRERK